MKVFSLSIFFEIQAKKNPSMLEPILAFRPGEKEQLIRDLLAAAKSGDLDEVKQLTTTNTNNKNKKNPTIAIDSQDPNSKEQAIHKAAAGNQIEIIKYLLSRSNDNKLDLVNGALDDNGQTPLFHAAFEGKLEAVQFLVEQCKAIVSKKDKFGRKAIDLARSQGHVIVMNYLSTAPDFGKTCCCC
jgi:ankyrin repeat protein